jgi:4-hydroxy-tetrahydrodipicolinate synthase
LAGHGLDGAVIGGTNGEFPSFTLIERRRAAEAAAAAQSGLRLVLGVGSCALGDVIELAAAAGDLGYDALLCPPPFYFRSAPLAGLAAFFGRVIATSSIPVLLYHIPQVTGIAIGDELLDRLADSGGAAGVKDSSGSPDEMDRLLGRFAGRSYLVGSDRLVSRCLKRGGSGSITAAANVAPALVAGVASDHGLQGVLDRLRSLLEEFGLLPAVKAILREMGFGDYATRPPLVGMELDRERELIERFEAMSGQWINAG